MNKYILKLIWIILLVGSLFFLKINLNRVFDWWSFCVGLVVVIIFWELDDMLNENKGKKINGK